MVNPERVADQRVRVDHLGQTFAIEYIRAQNGADLLWKLEERAKELIPTHSPKFRRFFYKDGNDIVVISKPENADEFLQSVAENAVAPKITIDWTHETAVNGALSFKNKQEFLENAVQLSEIAFRDKMKDQAPVIIDKQASWLLSVIDALYAFVIEHPALMKMTIVLVVTMLVAYYGFGVSPVMAADWLWKIAKFVWDGLKSLWNMLWNSNAAPVISATDYTQAKSVITQFAANVIG